MSKERLWRNPPTERRIAKLTRIENQLVNIGHTPENPSEALFEESDGIIVININMQDSRYSSQVKISAIVDDRLRELTYGSIRNGKEVERVIITAPMTDLPILYFTPEDYEIYGSDEIEYMKEHGALPSTFYSIATELELRELIKRLKKLKKNAR